MVSHEPAVKAGLSLSEQPIMAQLDSNILAKTIILSNPLFGVCLLRVCRGVVERKQLYVNTWVAMGKTADAVFSRQIRKLQVQFLVVKYNLGGEVLWH